MRILCARQKGGESEESQRGTARQHSRFLLKFASTLAPQTDVCGEFREWRGVPLIADSTPTKPDTANSPTACG